MWGAEGQALAAYELAEAEGGSGVLKPGDRIQGWTVTEIRRSGVTLRDIESGETQQVELRSRREKKEPVLAPGQPGGARRLPQVPMQPQ